MRQELTWFNDTLTQLIDRAVKSTLPSALLIAGPQGIGKLWLARTIAQRILGFNDTFHPDYLELSPEEDKKNISIDQVRHLIQHLSQTSHSNGYKIVVVYPAESMNLAASNALLKTLEEPQGKTLLILCTHQTSRLLPTIISRCQRIKIKMPTREEAFAWLNTQSSDPQLINKCLDFTGNRPLLALEMIQNDRLAYYEDCFNQLSKLFEKRINPMTLAESWAKNDVEEIVTIMQIFLLKHLLIFAKEQQRLEKIFDILDNITLAKRSLQSQSNPNKQLLLENLLMEFIWN